MGGLAWCATCADVTAGDARVYPAPPEEELSPAYLATVQGKPLAIYSARVAPMDPERRWKAMDDKANSAAYYEQAAFGYFDAKGEVEVEVRTPQPVKTVKVLPSGLRISPRVSGGSVFLHVPGPYPCHLTVEFDGSWQRALHLFANPLEKEVPKDSAPGVIYFGPGVHHVTSLVVTNNQTVYVAGGAIVHGIIGSDEPFAISGYSGLKNYSPTFSLRGTNITFRGRGIVDGTMCPTHARHLIHVQGSDVLLEGVILRDSSTWTVPIRRSDRVRVHNVKLLGYRANSDGIDICNSRDVTVERSFIRTLDDLIVVKTDKGQGESKRILAEKCVLWNEVAHALSVGAELRENVDGVVFRDCDIIHDMGREWTLRVYHCDAARISNIRFEDLRIEESPRLISLWIDKAFWSRDTERGHINQVVFRNIQAQAKALQVQLKGFDETHLVENVEFDKVVVNDRPLRVSDVKTNDYVRNLSVKP